MGSKIILTGAAKDVRIKDQIVSFRLVTGPAVQHPPKGLKLFGQVSYQVQCVKKQWNKARYGPDDNSDLIIEGYLEPRVDEETGKLYIAVVAMSVLSMRVQNERKLVQLTQAYEEALVAFKKAREEEVPEKELESKAAVLVKAQESLDRFRERHPELTGPEK